MSLDLLKTKITGSLFITLDPRLNWHHPCSVWVKKAIKASLFSYVHDAFITLNGTISFRESDVKNWKIIEYSSEKRTLSVSIKLGI